MNKLRSLLVKVPLNNNRDILLLASLVILICTLPFLEEYHSPPIIGRIMSLIVLIMAAYSISFHRVVFWIAGILILFSILDEIHLILNPLPQWLALHYFRKMVSFFFFSVVLFHYMLVKNAFTYKDLPKALCIYLLTAISFGNFYCAIESYWPGSFSFSTVPVSGIQSPLMYYSFVTLATVGYGDITPVATLTRLLSVFEAMFGIFYIAIMIGRMVGMRGKGD